MLLDSSARSTGRPVEQTSCDADLGSALFVETGIDEVSDALSGVAGKLTNCSHLYVFIPAFSTGAYFLVAPDIVQNSTLNRFFGCLIRVQTSMPLAKKPTLFPPLPKLTPRLPLSW
jgi:hypothetical protein